MNYTLTADNLENLESHWKSAGSNLEWPYVFVLPPWLKAWWRVFGSGMDIFIRTVRQEDNIVGIAPLRKTGDTAFFIGDADVCDYQDFIVARGSEKEFFAALLDDLKMNHIIHLDLKHLRPESVALTGLVPIVENRGGKTVVAQEEVNVEMDLPSAWDGYLDSLHTKQRHEVKRKLRRLNEAGEVEFRFLNNGDSLAAFMESFFKMFVESREDKADFLTEQRKAFFISMMEHTAGAGILKLGVLSLDSRPIARIICFDYNNCLYLYNSGYDPDYVSLSAGLLSKVLAIKDSIEHGKKKFDFLKGAETYKYHLGGKEVPLYRCLIDIG